MTLGHNVEGSETAMMSRRPVGNVDRPISGGLTQVLEVILEKDWIIDVFAKISFVGFDVLSAVHVRTHEDAPAYEPVWGTRVASDEEERP